MFITVLTCSRSISCFANLEWPNVKECFDFEAKIWFFRFRHGGVPPYMKTYSVESTTLLFIFIATLKSLFISNISFRIGIFYGVLHNSLKTAI